MVSAVENTATVQPLPTTSSTEFVNTTRMPTTFTMFQIEIEIETIGRWLISIASMACIISTGLLAFVSSEWLRVCLPLYSYIVPVMLHKLLYLDETRCFILTLFASGYIAIMCGMFKADLCSC